MKTFTEKLRPVLSAWTAFLAIFCLVIWLGHSMTSWQLPIGLINLARAIGLSIGFVAVIWVAMKSRKDHSEFLGTHGALKNLKHFVVGMGLLAGPLLVTLLISKIFGWANYELNPNSAIVKQQLFAALIVLLFEAFPEEIAFRGYLFGRLRTDFSAFKSGLITVILFVLLPLIVVPFQIYVIDMPVTIGGSNAITGGYIMYMTLFGCLTAFLRVLTGSVWTGIGFHLMFVSMNHFLGIRESSLIVIRDYTNEGFIQLTLLTSILFVLIGIVMFARNKSKRILAAQNLSTR